VSAAPAVSASGTSSFGFAMSLDESPDLRSLLSSSDPVVRRAVLRALKSTGWMVQQNWRQYFRNPPWPEVNKLTKMLDTRAGLKFLRQFVRYKALSDQMAVAIGFGKGRSVKKKGGSYTGLGSYGLSSVGMLDADPYIMKIAEKAESGWSGRVTDRMRGFVAASTKAKSKAKKPKVGRNYVALRRDKSSITVPRRSVSGDYFSRIMPKIPAYFAVKLYSNLSKLMNMAEAA